MKIDYPDAHIKNILEKTRTIAVVGASANKERDSYKVMSNLIKHRQFKNGSFKKALLP